MGKKSVPIAALNIPRKRVLTTKDNDIDVWPAAGSFNAIMAGNGKKTLYGASMFTKDRRSHNWQTNTEEVKIGSAHE